MGKKVKTPSSRESKGIHIASPRNLPASTDNETLLFSLEHLVDGYCLERCEADIKKAFAEALFKRRKMTWMELKSADRHGLGYEIIHHSSIRCSIPSIITEDIKIICFRFKAKAPMLGYRQGRVFHIVWIDPKFEVYNH